MKENKNKLKYTYDYEGNLIFQHRFQHNNNKSGVKVR